MSTDPPAITITPPTTPYGKIFGVVKYRYQLKQICESLAAIHVRDLEILDGSTGRRRLMAWEEEFSHYFLGQRETDLLSRYVEAINSEFIVFTAVVESGQENTVAASAKHHGATQISHFGNSVVTSY